MTLAEKTLDVVCVGRSSVDLYGEQVGGRLEEMASFAKYVGGCPANISIGTARLGLRSALITRVGDEHMGRFIREQLAREGVDTRGVITDPGRLTALVILGIRDKANFPLIFYREDCADAALDEGDIEEALVADSRAVLVTGTHFSRPNLDAASRKAMRLARRHGARIVLDIDYRPVLWGLAGHGLGEERFIANDRVSEHLQTILPDCDVIVGTEEEIHIAGGSTDTLRALRRVRDSAPDALIVLKRGPMGCVALPGEIPGSIEDGISGPGFPVEVFNVLGAGDSFLSGFLRGFLRDLPLAECCRLANACGAFAVSRHGCAPAVPSWIELQAFLNEGSPHRRLREDPHLEQLHWSTNRRPEWPQVLAFAFDHRAQFVDLCERTGADPARISQFKRLALAASRQVGGSRKDWGVLLDGRLGEDALAEATGSGCWIGRPIELPGSIPLRFEGGPDLGCTLREWPQAHCVKCLVHYHPDDPEALRLEQERQVLILADACRRTGHELLLEVIPGRSAVPVADDTLPRAIQRFYGLGVFPDWWKLPDPATDAAWQRIDQVIQDYDPFCRGVLLLGLDATEADLEAAFARAANVAVCKGFAIGRTIFGNPARAWFAGEIDDGRAIQQMASAYQRMIDAWERVTGRGS
ncbi:MAG TPA: 5-dehydro-2-deoxygluconokinase [Geminicoccus sp.]|jgi:5-dehydro-2-deoxygluconokinase|uniref:bifunctional 5-dehydro-2-deoxygluconokinase/5-dehydro-2- deoxyphosphogluconate aldolase n=1 Tax=Geminicoccus sp. TaxID=2024832 RepID=UPI002E37A4CC|nr:5-dehydro-2-deoxygluconokinase [Geminicoccus sp.]HEX2528855.1 5-dehydro-2-deoxygluconokinase [Geminicoccus sp.]